MTHVNIPFAGRYRLRDARDTDVAKRISDFIARANDAFGRNSEIGHVTGSAVVVNEDRSHVVLTHHAKLDRGLQLGGHCDGIRDPHFVAKKEAYEESGLTRIVSLSSDMLDIDIHSIPAIRKIPEHLHFDVRYLFAADKTEPFRISHESKDLRWVPLADLASFTDDESVLRLARKVREL